MHNYLELKIWQEARKLVKEVYSLTAGFPKEEMYGLTSRVRRAVVSIPSNIAEGTGETAIKNFNVSWNMLLALYLNWKLRLFLPMI